VDVVYPTHRLRRSPGARFPSPWSDNQKDSGLALEKTTHLCFLESHWSPHSPISDFKVNTCGTDASPFHPFST